MNAVPRCPSIRYDIYGIEICRSFIVRLQIIGRGPFFVKHYDHLDVQTDVVVVGSGLTGLRAAISAVDAGAAVTIITNKKLGRDGATAMSTGGIVGAMKSNGDDPELHYQDTVASGKGIGDTALIRTLSAQSGSEIESLVSLGAQFREDSNGLVFSSIGDHSWPRSLVSATGSGTAYTVPMASVARQKGVSVLEYSCVVSLLQSDDGSVQGVAVLDKRTNRYRSIFASATVLATGGCGQMYPLSSNPIDITGDGFSLASRAGATLRDMEFIQFYPYRCIDPFTRSRVATQPGAFFPGGEAARGGLLFNAEGRRFMQDYDPIKWEATTRDLAARGIFDQIRNSLGVGDGVHLDLSNLTRKQLIDTNPKIAFALDKLGIDHQNYKFVVAPEAHYFMGGVKIDRNGKTSLENLFAAGEVAGGVQGANRLANNSLIDGAVFGNIAGKRAGQMAVERTKKPTHHDVQWSSVDNRPSMRSRKQGKRLTRRDIQQVNWQHLGIVRNHRSLQVGADALANLRELLYQDSITATENPEEWFSLRAMLDTSELCTWSAISRQESRGAHFREDFPESDPAWAVSIETKPLDVITSSQI